MNNNGVNESMFQFWGVEDEDNKNLLNFLIQDEIDLKEFMDKFYDGHILKNMMAYKKHKRVVNSMSKENFMEMVKNESMKKSALSIIYQEPISDTHIRNMDRYSVSYSELFDKSKELPHESLINLITGNYIVTNNTSDDFLIEL